MSKIKNTTKAAFLLTAFFIADAINFFSFKKSDSILISKANADTVVSDGGIGCGDGCGGGSSSSSCTGN